ncbi:MAG: PIN domain-containing protein [Thermoleophilaceae bacterium]|nr:PIN domain-containing protein [Thermoleophilaceae bacterium]
MGLTYIDSCVLLDAVVNPDPRGELARAAIVAQGTDAVCISPLVDLECMVRPLRSGDQNRIAAMHEMLARFRRLEIATRAFQLASHIRAFHGLKTADSLHVATASLGGCDQIWTTDRQLLGTIPGFAVEPSVSN